MLKLRTQKASEIRYRSMRSSKGSAYWKSVMATLTVLRSVTKICNPPVYQI